jgi:hypothetical protein
LQVPASPTTRLRRRFGRRAGLYRELEREIEELGPWYQPVDFGGGVVAPARSKSGVVHSPDSLDRGLGKWRAFVEPNLPLPLAGARVLEAGCNAGMLLVECVRAGASEAVGIEIDERYYRQARFVAAAMGRVRGRYFPLRVYRAAMEDFEWGLLGRFDLALLLNVLYHIGRFDGERHLTPEETFARQVHTVQGVAGIARHLVFGANPLDDSGFGRGVGSLRAIVDAAGLETVHEARYDHPRGYVLVARDPAYREPLEDAPLDRMVSKYFLPARMSAEKEYVDAYLAEEPGLDATGTRYYRLRTAREDWLTPGQARLPADLDVEPTYWIVPWSVKPRPAAAEEAPTRVERFGAVQERFHALIDSITGGGLDAKRGRVRAFRLVHPDHGAVYQYIDGNQRLGVVASLAEREPDRDWTVPVRIEQEIRRERLLDYPLTRQLIEEGRLTEADAYRWFDQAFWFLGGSAR